MDETTAAAISAAAVTISATALLGCAMFVAYAARIYSRWRTKDQ